MRTLLICCLLPFASFAATPSASDSQYPREFNSPQGSVVTHAPQIQSWTGYEMINGVSAVEVTLSSATEPAYGAIYYTANTLTDLEQHTVTFYDIILNKVSFTSASAEQIEELETLVRNTLGRNQLTLPLELVLQYLDKNIIPEPTRGLATQAPKIFYSTSDSRLLLFDGEPMLSAIQKTDLQFAVNTNWDLFYVDSEATWYLLDGKRWLSMEGRKLKGDWQPVAELPAVFKQLPDTLSWENARQAMPAKADNSALPTFFISEVPAELILVEGEPEFEAIGSTGISYATNTDADLFQYGRTYYFLVSGRWFSSQKLDGKWSYERKPPNEFATIPPDHPRGDVLVSVPGTPEAKMALLEAVIPRKAELSRSYVPSVTVSYTDNKPQFERIDPTQVYQAVNTQHTVLQTDNRYYLCYNAAWFSGDSPTGPWQVAEQIPRAIYDIPPSSAAYNCTHVYVHDSDDDSITTGYDSGYFNVYTSYSVMYGTGYYYRPYYYYPYYYGYPRSYGESAWYNPKNGNFGSRQTIAGPYGGASRVAVYNPETGAYGRGRAVWDDNEISRQGIAYNPSNGTGVYTNRYANEDGAWGRSIVKHDDKWVATQTERDGNSGSGDFKTSGGASGSFDREVNDGQMTGSGEISRNGQTVDSQMVRTEDGVARKFTGEDGNKAGYVKNSEGDLYAGKDGEVYKREDGEWSKRSDDGWEPVEPDGQRDQSRDQARDGTARDTQRPGGGNLDLDLQQSDIDKFNQRAPAQEPTQMGTGERDVPPAREYNPNDYRDSPSQGDFGGERDLRSNREQRDRSRVNQLDRDHSARQNGFERHSNRMNRGGAGGGRRMRRR